MEAFSPTILIADGDQHRRDSMVQLAREEGFSVQTAETQKRALAMLRAGLPDIFWAGSSIPDAGFKEFVDVVRAAYPALPALLLVDDDHWEEALHLVDAGAFDVVRDEDDPRLQRAALRRALADARARASVKEQRGLILGTQSRLTQLGPIMTRMLADVSDAFKQAMHQPDISLRNVETICATAMSSVYGNVPVVIMALERPSMVLRPRGISHEMKPHNQASKQGFPLAGDADAWRESLKSVGDNAVLVEKVRDVYGVRHVYAAPLGPDDEPYGIAAFLSPNAAPPSPEDEEMLKEVALTAGHTIRIARHFRAVLRRGGGGAYTMS